MLRPLVICDRCRTALVWPSFLAGIPLVSLALGLPMASGKRYKVARFARFARAFVVPSLPWGPVPPPLPRFARDFVVPSLPEGQLMTAPKLIY
jgi:hypothetical protein